VIWLKQSNCKRLNKMKVLMIGQVKQNKKDKSTGKFCWNKIIKFKYFQKAMLTSKLIYGILIKSNLWAKIRLDKPHKFLLLMILKIVFTISQNKYLKTYQKLDSSGLWAIIRQKFMHFSQSLFQSLMLAHFLYLDGFFQN